MMRFAKEISLFLFLLTAAAAAADDTLWPYAILDVNSRIGDDPAWADPAFDDSSWETGQWSELRFRGQILWLRQRIELPGAYARSGRPVALFLTAAAASEVWWDGKLIGRNGVVGDTRATESPGRFIVTFPLPANAASGEHLLALRLSSQWAGSRIDTPIDEMNFAEFGDPLYANQKHYLPSLILGGALALATLFLLVMFVRTRSLSTLALGLAGAAFLLQLLFETSRGFIAYTYDLHTFRAAGTTLWAWCAGMALFSYLLLEFRQPRPQRWLVSLGSVALVGAVLGRPPDLATIIALLPLLGGSLYVSIRAFLANKPGSKVATTGLVLIFLLLFIEPGQFLDLYLYLGFAVLLLGFFAEHLGSYERARRERQRAELTSQRLKHELLIRSVQPHFLMNTLTTMAEWVQESPKLGVAMIHALAEELTLLGQFAKRDLVSLNEELALCRAHLTLMEFRQDREFKMTVVGATEGIEIPPAIVHTLLENAFSHNNYSEGANFVLTVTADEDKQQLCFECPPGIGTENRTAGQGTGLAYVRARLRECFGQNWQFESAATIEGGWCTTLTIPATIVPIEIDSVATPEVAP
jgi:hypothetical protein